ncbi:MAG: hypothetical protein AAGF04_05870 [Chlamydiota bacterium]
MLHRANVLGVGSLATTDSAISPVGPRASHLSTGSLVTRVDLNSSRGTRLSEATSGPRTPVQTAFREIEITSLASQSLQVVEKVETKEEPIEEKHSAIPTMNLEDCGYEETCVVQKKGSFDRETIYAISNRYIQESASRYMKIPEFTHEDLNSLLFELFSRECCLPICLAHQISLGKAGGSTGAQVIKFNGKPKYVLKTITLGNATIDLIQTQLHTGLGKVSKDDAVLQEDDTKKLIEYVLTQRLDKIWKGDFSPGNLFQREKVVHIIAQEVFAMNLPKTEIGLIGSEEVTDEQSKTVYHWHLLQEYVPNNGTLEKCAQDVELDNASLSASALLRILVDDSDPNAGNFLLQGTKVIPIDFSWSFQYQLSTQAKDVEKQLGNEERFPGWYRLDASKQVLHPDAVACIQRANANQIVKALQSSEVVRIGSDGGVIEKSLRANLTFLKKILAESKETSIRDLFNKHRESRKSAVSQNTREEKKEDLLILDEKGA